MHAETVIALVSTGLAAIIAVVVPWMAFRLALRQDRARWLRGQRAQLYVDLLTEAHAEQEYFHYAMAADEDRERLRKYWTDLRLAPLEIQDQMERKTARGYCLSTAGCGYICFRSAL